MEKNTNSHVKQPFDIVLNKDTRVLILGSFPSVKSREFGFYYMNPQNRFWKVMSNIFNEDFIASNNEEKRNLLLKNHIGLYDVIEECDIVGSSDSSIKHAKILDIYAILRDSKVEKIVLNGNKAYTLFIKYFPELKEKCFALPSTSPANAKIKITELSLLWKEKVMYND